MEKINAFRGDYFFLSNFYDVTILIGNVVYHSAEAAFQAMKIADVRKRYEYTYNGKTFDRMTASEAKRAGRHVPLREDWESVKYEIMRDIVMRKFDQHPYLKAELLATGDAYLEEGNTWGDRTWGTVNGTGKNWLGKILMDVRNALRNGN